MEIYDLVDAEYRLIASGQCDETISVTEPFALALTPAELVQI